MRFSTRSIATTLAVLLAFTLQSLASPGVAQAQYHSRSDEIPGGANLTPILIIGGLVVGGLVVYKIAKSKSDKRASGPTIPPPIPVQQNDIESEEEPATPNEDAGEKQDPSAEDTRLRPQVGVDARGSRHFLDGRSLALSDITFRVGLSIGI